MSKQQHLRPSSLSGENTSTANNNGMNVTVRAQHYAPTPASSVSSSISPQPNRFYNVDHGGHNNDNGYYRQQQGAPSVPPPTGPSALYTDSVPRSAPREAHVNLGRSRSDGGGIKGGSWGYAMGQNRGNVAGHRDAPHHAPPSYAQNNNNNRNDYPPFFPLPAEGDKENTNYHNYHDHHDRQQRNSNNNPYDFPETTSNTTNAKYATPMGITSEGYGWSDANGRGRGGNDDGEDDGYAASPEQEKDNRKRRRQRGEASSQVQSAANRHHNQQLKMEQLEMAEREREQRWQQQQQQKMEFERNDRQRLTNNSQPQHMYSSSEVHSQFHHQSKEYEAATGATGRTPLYDHHGHYHGDHDNNRYHYLDDQQHHGVDTRVGTGPEGQQGTGRYPNPPPPTNRFVPPQQQQHLARSDSTHRVYYAAEVEKEREYEQRRRAASTSSSAAHDWERDGIRPDGNRRHDSGRSEERSVSLRHGPPYAASFIQHSDALARERSPARGSGGHDGVKGNEGAGGASGRAPTTVVTFAPTPTDEKTQRERRELDKMATNAAVGEGRENMLQQSYTSAQLKAVEQARVRWAFSVDRTSRVQQPLMNALSSSSIREDLVDVVRLLSSVTSEAQTTTEPSFVSSVKGVLNKDSSRRGTASVGVGGGDDDDNDGSRGRYGSRGYWGFEGNDVHEDGEKEMGDENADRHRHLRTIGVQSGLGLNRCNMATQVVEGDIASTAPTAQMDYDKLVRTQQEREYEEWGDGVAPPPGYVVRYEDVGLVGVREGEGGELVRVDGGKGEIVMCPDGVVRRRVVAVNPSSYAPFSSLPPEQYPMYLAEAREMGVANRYSFVSLPRPPIELPPRRKVRAVQPTQYTHLHGRHELALSEACTSQLTRAYSLWIQGTGFVPKY